MSKNAEKNVSTITKSADTDKPVATTTPQRALSPFEEMQREMDRVFESFFPRNWLRPMHMGWPSLANFSPIEMRMPKVDIIERDEVILVRAEVPGVEKKDINVSVTEDSITISGQSESETKEEKGNYHRSEISRGSFSRTLALPSTVNSEKAKASFKDGILEVSVPKTTKTKRHTINIE